VTILLPAFRNRGSLKGDKGGHLQLSAQTWDSRTSTADWKSAAAFRKERDNERIQRCCRRAPLGRRDAEGPVAAAPIIRGEDSGSPGPLRDSLRGNTTT
jgi:heme-degrading monooxygenase HmoA